MARSYWWHVYYSSNRGLRTLGVSILTILHLENYPGALGPRYFRDCCMVLSRRKRPILTAIHLDAFLRGNLNLSNHSAGHFISPSAMFSFFWFSFSSR